MQPSPKKPYRYPLSEKLKADLEKAHNMVEPYRRRTYGGLVGLFVGGITLAPFLIVAIALAAKHGWLWWVAVIKPYLSWLAPKGLLTYSSRYLSRAYMVIIGSIIYGIVLFFRQRVFNRLDKAILPLVCKELHLEYSAGNLTSKSLKKNFNRKPTQLFNPLSMKGNLNGTAFKAHLIMAINLNPSVNSMIYTSQHLQRDQIFQGLFIVIPHNKNNQPEILVTHKDSPLSSGKLLPVNLKTTAAESHFTIWSDKPSKARSFLKDEFLEDILSWDSQPNDLPKMDIHFHPNRVEIYIAADHKDWLLSRRLSHPFNNIEPTITMLTSWSILKQQLETLVNYYPELFE